MAVGGDDEREHGLGDAVEARVKGDADLLLDGQLDRRRPHRVYKRGWPAPRSRYLQDYEGCIGFPEIERILKEFSCTAKV